MNPIDLACNAAYARVMKRTQEKQQELPRLSAAKKAADQIAWSWRPYFHAFCRLHGQPVPFAAGGLLFHDGWRWNTYLTFRPDGIEIPPPCDPAERLALQREFVRLFEASYGCKLEDWNARQQLNDDLEPKPERRTEDDSD